MKRKGRKEGERRETRKERLPRVQGSGKIQGRKQKKKNKKRKGRQETPFLQVGESRDETR